MTEKHTIEDVYQDVELIRREVHNLSATKQDKVKAVIFIPFILYLLTQSFTGIWWASKMTAALENIEHKLVEAAQDRFYGRDGDALQRLLNTQMQGLNAKIDNVDERQKEHRKDTQLCRERIKQNEQMIVDMKARLRNLEDFNGRSK